LDFAICQDLIPPPLRRRPGSRIKNFAQWKEHEPVERWSLLHDAHGARFGCMTTNLAESYNFLLRGNRALPLTSIIEGIFYCTLKYFKERREEAQMHNWRNPNTPYCEKIPNYMEKKIGKGRRLMTHKYRGSQQSSREVKPKFIDSTQGEPKNIYKP
jgi:hypothetical protein